MRILGLDKLDKASRKHPDARDALRVWIASVERNDWSNVSDLLKQFNRVKYIPENGYCFRIKNNAYRLHTQVSFEYKTVKNLGFWNHAEYDKERLNTR